MAFSSQILQVLIVPPPCDSAAEHIGLLVSDINHILVFCFLLTYSKFFSGLDKRETEIFIRIKQATKRDMPIKPGAYCLATYQ